MDKDTPTRKRTRQAAKEPQQEADIRVEQTKISDLIPDDRNFNKGTQFGQHLIEKSLRELGAGRSILLDKNNRIIAGNKTTENAAAIDMEDVIIVETDGTKLVAVKRTDIDIDSEQGRKMALADNATSAANLEWDEEELKAVAAEFDGINPEEWGIKEKVKKAKEEMEGEVPFTEVLNEEHNYIVLYFDNTVDWLQAETMFDIKPVELLPTAENGNKAEFGTHYGVGRVINGAAALEKIRKAYEHIS